MASLQTKIYIERPRVSIILNEVRIVRVSIISGTSGYETETTSSIQER